MQDSIVKKLFQEQAKFYALDSREATLSPLIDIFLEWSKRQKKTKKLKVCEFGGAGGILLASIGQKTDKKINFYNAEIIKDYQKYQASPDIKFFVDSVLDSHFADKFFDCLIIRDILHHLVGKNYPDTIKNQKKALKELKRLIKPDGLILIEELTEQYTLVAKLIYWLSKINSKIGLRADFLEISPYTVVCFLTPKSLEKMVNNIFGQGKIIRRKLLPVNKKWQERLPHLGFSSVKVILAVKA